MELVADVGEALAVGPADRGELRVGQRLGDHAVVVDRRDVVADALQQRLERVGGQRHLAGADAAERRGDEHARRRPSPPPSPWCPRRCARPSDIAAAFRPHTSRAGSTIAARSLRHRPPSVGRRVRPGRASPSASSHSTFWPSARSWVIVVAQLVDVARRVERGGDVDHAGALVVAVDACSAGSPTRCR